MGQRTWVLPILAKNIRNKGLGTCLRLNIGGRGGTWLFLGTWVVAGAGAVSPLFQSHLRHHELFALLTAGIICSGINISYTYTSEILERIPHGEKSAGSVPLHLDHLELSIPFVHKILMPKIGTLKIKNTSNSRQQTVKHAVDFLCLFTFYLCYLLSSIHGLLLNSSILNATFSVLL